MPQTGASAPKTKVTKFNRHLRSIGACEDARAWADGMDAKTAWAAKDGETHVNLVRCACACARTALQYVPKGEDRPRLAIEAAEQWCEDPSSENASYAAAAAATAAYASYATAAYAAYAAAAAYASNAATAAYASANAAATAAYASYAAAGAARKEMCGLIRERLAQPWSEK